MNKYYLLSLSDEESNAEIVSSDSKYLNLNLLRTDSDLFNEEDYVKLPLINVKRVKLPKGEDWEIFEDKKLVLTLKGTRFSNAEKAFLRTPNGMNFLLDSYKVGIRTLVKFKEALKNKK